MFVTSEINRVPPLNVPSGGLPGREVWSAVQQLLPRDVLILRVSRARSRAVPTIVMLDLRETAATLEQFIEGEVVLRDAAILGTKLAREVKQWTSNRFPRSGWGTEYEHRGTGKLLLTVTRFTTAAGRTLSVPYAMAAKPARGRRLWRAKAPPAATRCCPGVAVEAHPDLAPGMAIDEPDMLPRRRGGIVLYLDFDGVLHPEDVWRRLGYGPYVATPPGHVVFEHAALLARCLEPYPELRIVLSTSWVRVFRSVRKVARRLPSELRRRVVGATFHGRMDPAWFRSVPRGAQVWGDVCRRRHAAWLALDDDDAGWPAVCRGHLLHTDPVLGISDPAVLAQLQARLAAMHRPEVGWP